MVVLSEQESSAHQPFCLDACMIQRLFLWLDLEQQNINKCDRAMPDHLKGVSEKQPALESGRMRDGSPPQLDVMEILE